MALNDGANELDQALQDQAGDQAQVQEQQEQAQMEAQGDEFILAQEEGLGEDAQPAAAAPQPPVGLPVGAPPPARVAPPAGGARAPGPMEQIRGKGIRLDPDVARFVAGGLNLEEKEELFLKLLGDTPIASATICQGLGSLETFPQTTD